MWIFQVVVALFTGSSLLGSFCLASSRYLKKNAFFEISTPKTLEVSNSGRLQTELLWSRYKSSLDDIISGLEKMIPVLEADPKQMIDSCNTTLTKYLRICMSMYEMKLQISHLRNNVPMNMDAQIPTMRFLQLNFGIFWESFDSHPRVFKFYYENTIIRSLDKYNDPREELQRALDFSHKLAELSLAIKESPEVKFSLIYRNITLLLHRVIMGNCLLYTIQHRSASFPKEPRFFGNIHGSNDPNALLMNVLGLEKVRKYCINVNVAFRLLTSHFIDNEESIGKVSPVTAVHTLKSIVYSELTQFYKTGLTSSIVSRLILQVVIKHKGGGDQELYESAKAQYDNLERLEFEERQNSLMAPSKKAKAAQKESVKAKDVQQQQKKKKKKGNQQRERPNTKTKIEEKEPPIPSTNTEEDNVSDAEDTQVAKVALLKTPFASLEVNYLRIGQFCYDNVLYPLLDQLQMGNYTWTNVSEMCSTDMGLEALAKLSLNQSQVDLCISIVRNRVPYAHPKKLSPEDVMDDLSILKTQHIQKHAVFDVLGQHLATKTDWTLVNGAQEMTFEPAKLVHAALRVGEYCWREVVDPVAISLGLNTTTTSLTEIFEQAKMNGLELGLFNTCRSLIKLRNSYAHQGVSSKDAKEALQIIYHDDPEKPMILDSVFARVVNHTSEGIEFY